MLKYFYKADTAKGRVDLYDRSKNNQYRKIMLKDANEVTISAVIENLLDHYTSKGSKIELIYEPVFGRDASPLYDGIVLNDKRTMICGYRDDNSAEGYSMAGIYDVNSMTENRTILFSTHRIIEENKLLMNNHKRDALEHHNRLKAIYGKYMDYAAVEKYTEYFTNQLFAAYLKRNDGQNFHRFFGTFQGNGQYINYLGDLVQGLGKRYLLKGREGVGKSGFLKKLATKALQFGYDTEIYHCNLDPDNIDAVIVRDAGLCFIDATAPHEIEPRGKSDVVIDLYRSFKTGDADKERETEIYECKMKYKLCCDMAATALKENETYIANINELMKPDTVKISAHCENIKKLIG